MPINMFEVLVFILIAGLYTLFVNWFAIKNRIKLAERVDVYLGGDNPSKLKDAVFVYFSLTKLPFLLLRMTTQLLMNLFKLRNKHKTEVTLEERTKKAVVNAPQMQSKELNSLFLQCSMVAFQRSPITSIISIFILISLLIIFLLLNKLKLIEKSLDELPEFLEDSSSRIFNHAIKSR